MIEWLSEYSLWLILAASSLACLDLSWRRTALIIAAFTILNILLLPAFEVLANSGFSYVALAYCIIDAMTICALYGWGSRGEELQTTVIMTYLPVNIAMTWQFISGSRGFVYNNFEIIMLLLHVVQALLFVVPIYEQIRRLHNQRINRIRFSYLARLEELQRTGE